MPEYPNPKTIITKLSTDSEKVDNTDVKANMLEAVKSMEYLLILLKECADYIEGVREYPDPPRFIRAVREALNE